MYKSPLTNYDFGVAMGGLLLKLQNFKNVKLIFGHPVNDVSNMYCKIPDHTTKIFFKLVISIIAGLHQPPSPSDFDGLP